MGVVLLLGLGAVIAFGGGKNKKRVAPADFSPELTSESVVPKDEMRPKKPERPPPPEISQEIIAHAKALVEEAAIEKAKGDALYDEAMAAKRDGDEKSWQAKLEEAREHYINVRDMWNEQIVAEIEGELPPGCEWDADEVANHWIGKEAGKITKALQQLPLITKQLRMH